jgi:2-polyprenyl-3-methyl-5-hydroxy-6-metoxy-1,4-benzoquinol methylase
VRSLALYSDQPLGVRIHTFLRAWSAPLDVVVNALPSRGRLLDVGCGHGLVSNEAALRSPELRVLGIDIADGKIAAARKSVGTRSNVEFRAAPLEGIAEADFDAVSVIDVLYLVPQAAWTSFLGTCFQKLSPGGAIVVKEIGTTPRWKFERLRLQEYLSTRILGITKGESMYFESGEELKRRLENAGFEAVAVEKLDRGFASPHLMVTGRKPLNAAHPS